MDGVWRNGRQHPVEPQGELTCSISIAFFCLLLTGDAQVFVQQEKWVSPEDFADLFTLGSALPGPAFSQVSCVRRVDLGSSLMPLSLPSSPSPYLFCTQATRRRSFLLCSSRQCRSFFLVAFARLIATLDLTVHQARYSCSEPDSSSRRFLRFFRLSYTPFSLQVRVLLPTSLPADAWRRFCRDSTQRQWHWSLSLRINSAKRS